MVRFVRVHHPIRGTIFLLATDLAHELQVLKVPLLPRRITEHAHGITGIDIHPGAAIAFFGS